MLKVGRWVFMGVGRVFDLHLFQCYLGIQRCAGIRNITRFFDLVTDRNEILDALIGYQLTSYSP
jgi:hypothetical protein